MKNIFKAFLLPVLLLALLGGCQPETASVTALREPDRPDYSCAYFYFMWGRQAELSLRFEEALEAYRKALICDPEAEHIIRKIPVLLLRMDRGEEAISMLQEFLEEKSADIGIRMLLARIYIAMDDQEKAAEQYRAINSEHPEDTTSLMLLSELYLNGNELEKAQQALHDVLAIKSDSYPARVLLARTYIGNREYEKALAEYDRALQINWSTDLLLEKSDVYRLWGKYDEAVDIYRQILAAHPENERVALALISFLLREDREEEALAELEKLKNSRSLERADLAIARFYARLEKFDEAAKILRQSLTRESRPDTRYLLAIVLTQSGEFEQALGELRKIGRPDEEYEESIILQVRILRIQEKLDQAIEILEKAVVDEQNRSPDMYVMLAALYHLQGSEEQGRKTFDRALAAFPDDDQLLYEYGLFLDTSGHPEEAMTVMQEVIRRQPEHGEALNYVGYSWADQSINLDKALDYIEKAVQLKPENGYVRDSLGWIYYRLGRYEEALSAMQEAVRLSKEDPTIYEHLGDVYFELGRNAEALESYRKARDLLKEDDPALDGVREKIRHLETLER